MIPQHTLKRNLSHPVGLCSAIPKGPLLPGPPNTALGSRAQGSRANLPLPLPQELPEQQRKRQNERLSSQNLDRGPDGAVQELQLSLSPNSESLHLSWAAPGGSLVDFSQPSSPQD